MADFSPSSTFEKKTLVGLWWIPEQKRQCYGTLYFDMDGKQELHIMGYFEEKFPGYMTEYKVIHGLCEIGKQKKKVTIFHSWITRITQQLFDEPNVSKTVISFGDIWIGNCYWDSPEDVQFASFYFGLNNLESWQDERNTFSVDFDSEFKKISTEMKLPEPISIFSDEYVSISIDYWRQAPGFSTGQLESTMRYCPQLFIKANEGILQYYGDRGSYRFYLSWIFQLFELFMTGHTFPFCLHGNGFVPQEKSTPQIRSDMLYSRDITMKQRKEIQPCEILFPCRKIKEYLFELSDNFQKSYNKMGTILETLCSSLCTTTHNTHSLPNLLYTLEGLQQLFYHSLGEKDSPRNQKNYESFTAQKNAVIEKCDTKDLKKFVKEEIAWRVTFRDRLYAMLLDVSSIFQFLDEALCDKVANDLKKIRNAGAHSDDREQDNLNIHLLFRKIQFVQFLQIAIILKSCGLPAETIKECFENSYPREFNAMANELKDHYTRTAEGNNG